MTKHTVVSQHQIVPALQLHEQSNYLKVLPGGHCFYCHEDYPDAHDHEACRIQQNLPPNGSYPCPDKCKFSKFYTPVLPGWVNSKL